MLDEITLPALEYICLNMRDVDKREIYNILDHDNPIILAYQAHYVAVSKGRGRIAWHNGRPTAFIAFTEERPTVWTVSMFGTDDFRNVAFECMRWARSTAADLINERNGRRLYCDSHIDHDEAHRFLTALGAVHEGPPMRHFGKDGSDYIRFVWIKDGNGRIALRGLAKTVN